MKIDINKIKLTPSTLGFNFCVYGQPSEEVIQWCKYWKLEMKNSDAYTNIMINDEFDIHQAFNEHTQYEYIDGFSPNINKYLHVGHLSNMVIAKAYQKMGLGKKFIAILGDTLTGDVTQNDALNAFYNYCKTFDYNVDDTYFASKVKLNNQSLLSDGTDEYAGTKIFDMGDGEKIVAIKKTNATTYFYQDVALAEYLNASTLYLTGLEQENHFKSLKKLFPSINHKGLGLVLLDGKKMSTSEGNVIFLDDFIKDLMALFNNDIKLVYNIMAGQILKSTPAGSKSIDMKVINNPKLSLGLYLSYTMAHIKSCGVTTQNNKFFYDKELQFHDIKSKCMLSPNVLFDALVNHCKKINKLYETHYIKDNETNIKIFSDLISDLEYGMLTLGLYSIDKV